MLSIFYDKVNYIVEYWANAITSNVAITHYKLLFEHNSLSIGSKSDLQGSDYEKLWHKQHETSKQPKMLPVIWI